MDVDAERAVLDTLYRYGHAIDYGLEDDWVDCFTEDAVWDVRPGPATTDGVVPRLVRGRAELAAFVAQHTRAPGAYHKHVLVDPRLEFDGDECRADSYFLRVDAHPAGSFIRAFGRYRDTLVRGDDGRWRFRERIAEIDGSHPLAAVAGDAHLELFAIEEIKRLKARYCRLLDTKQWDQWGEIFTDDARLQYGPDDGDVVDGRTTIVAHVRRALEGATTVHQAKMPEIDILDATRAHGIWAMFDYTDSPHGFTDHVAAGQADEASASGRPGRFAKQGWGHYEEQYERGDDGRWRIASLRLTRLRVDRL